MNNVWGNLEQLGSEYTCIAFDVGRTHTGIAIGNSVLQQGKALPAITFENYHPTSWQQITDLLAEWQVGLIIVGEPKDTPKTAKKMHGFAKAIFKQTAITTVMVDESYTTVTAKDDFIARNRKLPEKTEIDSLAATLLIQHWFDIYA